MKDETNLHAQYARYEREFMPLLRRNAARCRVLNYDDALQEARLVLLRAIQKCSPGRDMRRFVQRCLKNAFATIRTAARRQCRMPHCYLRDGDTWTLVPVALLSLGEEHEPIASDDPEAECSERESEEGVRLASMKIGLRLNEPERRLFEACQAPPADVLCQPGDVGFNKQIAARLGVNKHKLDWALCRVRGASCEELRGSELVEHRMSGPDWPYLQHSFRWDDRRLVEISLGRRQLDRQVQSRDSKTTGNAKMLRVTYGWGQVLSLQLGRKAVTMFMQGRFSNKGFLHGRKYGAQRVPIDWYGRCMKKLDEA